jgi:hypothetical protein
MFIFAIFGENDFNNWVLSFYKIYDNMKEAQHYISKNKNSQF